MRAFNELWKVAGSLPRQDHVNISQIFDIAEVSTAGSKLLCKLLYPMVIIGCVL